MSTEIQPCPFCGSTNLSTDDARDFVSCLDCYTEGPCNPGQGSAANVEAWNQRALSAQPPADADALTEATARYTLPTSIAAFVEGAEWALQPTAPSVPPVLERLTETQIDSASPLRIESAHWFKLGARWAERALIGGEG